MPLPVCAASLLCVVAFWLPVLAQSIDGAKRTQWTTAQATQRLFYAKGTHTCQSRTRLGHKCEVRGQYTSCHDAGNSLKLDDCCANTKEGGTSIKFSLDACSPYSFPR
jgi:hypothetical protein